MVYLTKKHCRWFCVLWQISSTDIPCCQTWFTIMRGLSKCIDSRSREHRGANFNYWFDQISKINYILDEFHCRSHKYIKDVSESKFKLSNHPGLAVNFQLCDQRFKQWNKTCRHSTSMSTSCSLLFCKLWHIPKTYFLRAD